MKLPSRILPYIVSRNRWCWSILSVTIFVLLSSISCGPPPPAVTPLTTPLPTPSPKPKKEGMDTAYFLNRMSDFSSWAFHQPNERMAMRSSHNPQEGPEDADYFIASALLEGATWNVLLDEKGPGCVTRIWITGHAVGRLRFYFDEEAQPRIDTTIAEFFSGKYQHFLSYVTFPATVSGGGNVNYFPLPFSQRCIIVTDSITPGFKYQVNTLRFDPNAKIITYNPSLDSETAAAFKQLEQVWGTGAPVRFFNSMKNQLEVEIAPKQRKLVFNAGQSGALDYFQLHISPLNAETVNSLKIQAYWDNLIDPSVDCTLRQFFGMFKEVKDWNSLPLGFWGKQDIFYCQFYMPFQNRGQIYLENPTNNPIKVSFNYHVEWKEIPDNFLYFYALPHQRQFLMGFLYPLLEFEGHGKLVGLNELTAVNKMEPPFFNLEGDEYFYLDGELKPSWNGTGMDDFYNGGDLLKNYTPFWFPTHGCIMRESKDIEIAQAYRFFMLDAIPFQTSLMMIQEIGCPIKFGAMATSNFVPTSYEWICYVYGKPGDSKPKRQENLSYFIVDKNEQGNPTRDCPVMQYQRLWMKIPPGDWWVHVAPIWDISQVHHQKLGQN